MLDAVYLAVLMERCDMRVLWINYDLDGLKLFLSHFKKPINYREVVPSVILQDENSGVTYMVRETSELSKYPLDALTRHELSKIFQ